MRLIPQAIHRRLHGRTQLREVLTNTVWLFGDRVVRMGIGLLVGAWVARYLGPEQFGAYNYATALVALFGIWGRLGVSQIVVRDVVREPQAASEILGSALAITLGASTLAYGAVVATSALVHPDQPFTTLLVAILGLQLLCQPADVVDFWFQAKVQNRYSVWAKNAAFLLTAALRVVLVIAGASLVAFAWATSAEFGLAVVALLVTYRVTGGSLRGWRPTLARSRAIFQQSWPLLLADGSIALYGRIDQVMIGNMLGDEAVGVYAAAFRMMQVWYFIPTAIAVSAFPAILKARTRSSAVYYEHLQRLYTILTWLGISLALPISLFGETIVCLLYGESFRAAGSVLVISAWAAIFVFQGVARGRWLVAEGLQRYADLYVGLGAVLNVTLNYLWIPTWGIQGAAMATLLSQATVAIGAPLLFRDTRGSALMLLRAFSPRTLWRLTARPAIRSPRASSSSLQ